MPAAQKPSRLKIVQGTDRKDRRRRSVNGQSKRAPAVPTTLSDNAKEEWRRLAPVAHRLGTLSSADVRAFSLLCETLATEREAAAVIRAEGLTLETGTGGKKTNPACGVLEKARSQATRLLAEFGLTPKARGSMNLETQAPKGNPYERF